MKVYNFGGKDKHLDPPDIPDEQPLIYFRCDICSGVFLLGDGSEYDNVCSDCYYESELYERD